MMKQSTLTTDSLVADALLRLRAIENLLVAKNIFTHEELKLELTNVSKVLLKEILQKANVPGDLDQLVDEISGVAQR